MDEQKILEIAIQFRKAIEVVPQELRPIGMQSFPEGACGDTSLLFGAFLVDLGILDFKYIYGERGSKADNTWTSHAWLQRKDLVIDLTADQFSDAPADVIVSSSSTWHKQFSTERSTEADFRRWHGYGADQLYPIYSKILSVLQMH